MQTEYTFAQYVELLITPNNELQIQSILTLNCFNNQLTELPALPMNLQKLYCNN